MRIYYALSISKPFITNYTMFQLAFHLTCISFSDGRFKGSCWQKKPCFIFTTFFFFFSSLKNAALILINMHFLYLYFPVHIIQFLSWLFTHLTLAFQIDCLKVLLCRKKTLLYLHYTFFLFVIKKCWFTMNFLYLNLSVHLYDV